MAYYIDSNNVKKNTKETANEKYEHVWKPGQNPSYAGIYRCLECGYEDLINRQCTKLPPCTNCEEKGHKSNTWKLLVKAEDTE